MKPRSLITRRRDEELSPENEEQPEQPKHKHQKEESKQSPSPSEKKKLSIATQKPDKSVKIDKTEKQNKLAPRESDDDSKAVKMSVSPRESIPAPARKKAHRNLTESPGEEISSHKNKTLSSPKPTDTKITTDSSTPPIPYRARARMDLAQRPSTPPTSTRSPKRSSLSIPTDSPTSSSTQTFKKKTLTKTTSLSLVSVTRRESIASLQRKGADEGDHKHRVRQMKTLLTVA